MQKEQSILEFDDVTLTISGSKYTCRSAPLHQEHGEESDEGMYEVCISHVFINSL